MLKPANVTFEQAAAAPMAAVTALQGLRDRGRVQPGQRGPDQRRGGRCRDVRRADRQVVRSDVTGVCSTRNVDMVRSIGADQVIDYTQEDFTKSGQRYDVILDMIGNHSFSDRRRALTPEGTLVLVGGPDTEALARAPRRMLKAFLVSPFVSQKLRTVLTHSSKEDLIILQELLAAGKVTPVIDRTYPLSEVPEAIRYLEEGHAQGKVVITVA